ncbi:amidohydrolase family protein, partial [uncultured Negativibacillus sp.]|uniref:amidohydrolase family protein n=1 Tax=uncultured Negativibacillus sp. TaxID=1980696 RepID=UPI0025D85694
MITKLLKNAVIVTVNPEREIFYHGAIAIENDRIAAIGDSAELEAKYSHADEVFDFSGKVIFPGFINTHNHLFQTLLKGLGDDMELKDWLSNMMFPASVYLEPEDTY